MSKIWPNSPALYRQRDIEDAEVIIGIDRLTQKEFLIYGRERLQEIARSAEARGVNFLQIEFDQRTDDLEKLLALVNFVKGRHDYVPGVSPGA